MLDAAGDPPVPGLDGRAAADAGGDRGGASTTATPSGCGPRRRRGADLLKRVMALPGFGKQKAQIFTALLAKQLDVRPDGWERRSATTPSRATARSPTWSTPRRCRRCATTSSRRRRPPRRPAPDPRDLRHERPGGRPRVAPASWQRPGPWQNDSAALDHTGPCRAHTCLAREVFVSSTARKKTTTSQTKTATKSPAKKATATKTSPAKKAPAAKKAAAKKAAPAKKSAATAEAPAAPRGRDPRRRRGRSRRQEGPARPPRRAVREGRQDRPHDRGGREGGDLRRLRRRRRRRARAAGHGRGRDRRPGQGLPQADRQGPAAQRRDGGRARQADRGRPVLGGEARQGRQDLGRSSRRSSSGSPRTAAARRTTCSRRTSAWSSAWPSATPAAACSSST